MSSIIPLDLSINENLHPGDIILLYFEHGGDKPVVYQGKQDNPPIALMESARGADKNPRLTETAAIGYLSLTSGEFLNPGTIHDKVIGYEVLKRVEPSQLEGATQGGDVRGLGLGADSSRTSRDTGSSL